MKSAVVGIGTIGPVHLDALTRLGEEIAALCDIRPERAVAAAERFHLSCPIFTDYEEMLDQVRPDIVHICTPHFCHADMIVVALTRGISVLCEKPLCIKESDIGRILAAEAASPAKLGVCHQNRTNPANLFARRLFSENRVMAAHGSVVWHRDAAYYGQDAWRGKWKTEGGGVLINQALHTLDLCQWFFGMPTRLSASVANLSLPSVIEVEDTAFLRCRGRTDFTFAATVGSAGDLPVSVTARLADGREVVVLPHAVIVAGQTAFFEEKIKTPDKCCYGNGHIRLIGDFYRCVRTDEPFEVSGREAARVVRMILAAYRSGGQEVKIGGEII